jgi:transposase-like protein
MVFALIGTFFAQKTTETTRAQCLSSPTSCGPSSIHSSDVLERLNGKVKRRSDAMRIFPNTR